MKKIIIYGAGEGAENFIAHNEKERKYNIVGVSDSYKRGKFKDYTILSPDKLKDKDYDILMITSMFGREIKDFLLNKGYVVEEKIKIADKTMITLSNYPFKHKQTKRYAENLLLNLIIYLNDHQLRYWVGGGTLLGLVRDNGIIKTDNDIDIVASVKDYEIYKYHLKRFKKKINTSSVEWKIYSRFDEDDIPLTLDLHMVNENHLRKFSFGIDFFANIEDSSGDIRLTSMRFSNKYFMKYEVIRWNDCFVKVPFYYQEFLEYVYGDWTKPKSNINSTDYPNLIDFNYSNYEKHTIQEIE